MGWLAWFRDRRRRLAAKREALRNEAQELLAGGSRMAAMLDLDARMSAAADDPAERRRLEAVRAIVNELAPREPRADTATRMHYR